MKPARTTKASRSGPLITLALGAAALAYLFFVFLPAQKALRALHTQSREKQNYIAQAQSLQTKIVQTQRKLDQTRQFADERRERAPQPARMGAFLAKVTQSTQAAGVETLRLDPLKTEPLDTLKKTPYELEVRGSFPEVFTLLARLEQLDAPNWVEELRIETQSEDREILQCELKMAVFAGHAENSD